jgi:O-antigen/teichoic acid export membrane protein
MSVMVFVVMVRSLLTGGTARFITEAYAKGDEEGVTRIASTMFPVYLASGLVILAAGLVFSWKIDAVLNISAEYLPQARLMMAILFLSFFVQLAFAPFRTGFFVRQRFVALNLIEVGTSLLRLALLLALLFGVSVRVLWVVVATESAHLIGITVQQIVSRRLVPALRFSLRAVRLSVGRSLVSFGGWVFLSQLANRIRTSADPIILNQLAAPLDVTTFYLGSLPQRQIDDGLVLITQPILPALTGMHALSQRRRLGRVFLRYNRILAWMVLLVTVPLMVYSREVIALYVGQRYLQAATVMVVLLVSSTTGLASSMLFKLAQATARMREFSWRYLAIHLLNLALTFYLVGALKMGAVGSALATLLAYLAGRPLLEFPLALRLAEVDARTWLRRTVIPAYGPALLAAAVWTGLKLLHPPGSWLELAGYVLIGWVAYGTVLLLLFLQEEDRQDLRALRARLHTRSHPARPADPAEPDRSGRRRPGEEL